MIQSGHLSIMAITTIKKNKSIESEEIYSFLYAKGFWTQHSRTYDASNPAERTSIPGVSVECSIESVFTPRQVDACIQYNHAHSYKAYIRVKRCYSRTDK